MNVEDIYPPPRDAHAAILRANTLTMRARVFGWGPSTWAALGRYSYQAGHMPIAQPRDAGEMMARVAFEREGGRAGFMNRTMRRWWATVQDHAHDHECDGCDEEEGPDDPGPYDPEADLGLREPAFNPSVDVPDDDPGESVDNPTQFDED